MFESVDCISNNQQIVLLSILFEKLNISIIGLNTMFYHNYTHIVTMTTKDKITEIEYDENENFDFDSEVSDDDDFIYMQLQIIYKNDDASELVKLLESDEFNKYTKSDDMNKKSFLTDILNAACTKGCENVIKLILEHELIIKNDCNPLVYAIHGTYDMHKKLNIVKILLNDKRFNPNIPVALPNVSRIETPLTIAIKNNYADIIKLVIECEDIDMNYMNEKIKSGYVTGSIMTPLYYACVIAKDITIINYLLDDSRVDPNIYVGNLTVFQHTCNIRSRNSNEIIGLAKIADHLYNHPRIDAHKLTKDGKTTLEMICGDHMNVIKNFI